MSSTGFLLFFLVVTGSSYVSSIQPPRASPIKPFSCQYYSDGTYTCYHDYHSTEVGEKEKPGTIQFGGFAITASGEGIKGTWTPEDGIMSHYDPSKPKRWIGDCQFSSEGFTCTGVPTTTVDEFGNMSGKGGGLFRGLAFTGEPGGSLRFAPNVGVVPASPVSSDSANQIADVESGTN